MSVIEETIEDEAYVDFNPQVVAALVEISQSKYHKILLVQDESGPSFFRETTCFAVDSDDNTEFFGPFSDAASALWGISLL